MEIASLGAGRMASALLRAFVHKDICKGKQLRITSRSPASREALASSLGAVAVADGSTAVDGADIVLICVKPRDVMSVLTPLAPLLTDRLVISIAAGISLSQLESICPSARVVRTMPNLPVEVGMGMTAIMPGKNVDASDLSLVRKLFQAVGEVVEIPESQVDAITALSGSGPAYFYLFLEALAEAGEALGLSREVAEKLGLQTARGAVELAYQTQRSPALLREQVTSPKGTTAAAIEVFESASFRKLIFRALEAAAQRSKELSQEAGKEAKNR